MAGLKTPALRLNLNHLPNNPHNYAQSFGCKRRLVLVVGFAVGVNVGPGSSARPLLPSMSP